MDPALRERFRQAGLESAGQRRNVTVLFVDIVGYTPLSEQIDNDDLYTLIQQYFAELVNAVYKYEGTVDKFTGDGLMALFGAPIAQENSEEMAVRAALDMQSGVSHLSQDVQARLGVGVRIRIGLNAGSVIVGSVGANLAMNYTAIGNTVNLASRLQTAAEPGAILVSEVVYRQTQRLFDFEVLPPLSLKGIEHPVPGFQVLGAKAKPGSVRGLEGLRAPLIGRDAELGQLRQALGALTSGKVGHLVVVTGDAGIGKSRLTEEFRALLDPDAVRVCEGHSLTYRRGVTYWVFQEVLRHLLQASPGLPEADLRARLSTHARDTLGSAAADALPYLEHLLGLTPTDMEAADRLAYLDAGQLRQQVFLAVRDLLLAEAQRWPVVLILEDLHWADEASLDLIRFLLDSIRQAPLFIYGNTRPFEVGPLAKVVAQARQLLGERCMVMTLQSLPPDVSAQLLSRLLAEPDLPQVLRDQILQRAAGNPFYLEEILRMLIDSGAIRRDGARWRLAPGVDVSTLGVPASLQDLILARFDQLPEAPRRVLQVASVIGRQFNLQLLAHLLAPWPEAELHETLDRLTERDYVLPATGQTSVDYVFRHVLVSDAIYGTLLKSRRSELHGQIGDAIEALWPDQLDKQAELLARHYTWSPRLDRALHYLLLAGQRAARGYANEQARQHFKQALALLAKVPHSTAQALQAQKGLGDVLVLAGEYQSGRACYQAALDLVTPAESAQFAKERGELSRKLGATFERQGDYDQALLCLAAAQTALEDSAAPLPVERAQILNDLGWTNARRGALELAERYLLQALELVEHSTQYDVIASIYNRLGGVYYQKDELSKAGLYVRKSLVLREEMGDTGAVARSYNNLGLLGWKRGDWDSALDDFQRSVELHANLGDIEGMVELHSNLGLLELDRGNVDAAREHLETSLASAQQIGHVYLVGLTHLNFSRLYVAIEDWHQAMEHSQRGLATFKEIASAEHMADLYTNAGQACLGLGNLEAARKSGEAALELIGQLDSSQPAAPSVNRASALRLLGEAARLRGDYETAAGMLTESADIFAALGNQVEQGRSTVALAQLAAARGDRAGARVRLNEARLIFRQLGARLDLRKLETLTASLGLR